ncbi:MAG: hypothetical protein SCG80_00425 [Nitrosomonadaceae bacterium]|nr:hypothetical protein [Nitrosomonadaceae bacterium]
MKLIKLSKIAMAVAALTAAPAAFALTPAQVDGSTARLWLSGASAPTAAVYKGMLTLCQGMQYKDALGATHTNPGTRDAHLYLELITAAKLPGSAGDRMAYTCTVQTDDSRAGSLEGKKVVVFHTVEGGSFNYVTPHISIAGEVNSNLPGNLKRTSNIEGLAASGQCANGTAEDVAVDISGIINRVGVYRGCATTTQTFTAGQARRAAVTGAPDRPEGGFSDTEYKINKLNLSITTTLSSIGTEVPTRIGQAFGVAVSYPLYYQLQKNDFTERKIASGCVAAQYTANSPNLAAACQPSMVAAKYTAFANAANIAGLDGSKFGAAAGTKVNLARRAITSGTQSASNLRFLNKPCASGEALGELNPTRAANSTATVVVTENSSTGGVKTTLTAATTANELGMGVVSVENVPVVGTDKWAFVKLNDVSPTVTAGVADAKQRANAISGSYDFWYELVAFTATTAFAEGRDLLSALTTSLGNPGITDLTGLFITRDAGVSGANVSKFARSGNSCQAPF